MIFLKKGIDKANGQNIYPHPNQTRTGNCFAYAAATCLYAFGLDHHSDLIPKSSEVDARVRFQYQITKMIEEIQSYYYEEGVSQAEAIREYINACGLNCKYDISEPALTKWDRDDIAGGITLQPNIRFFLDQLRACQDIIFSIRWGAAVWNPFGTTYRHAVGLVGVDEGTGEFILNNPWGNGAHLNPDEAKQAFDQGKPNTFTKHKYSTDSSGNILIPFDNDEAVIYGAVMVCPVKSHAVAIRSTVDSVEMYKAIPHQPGTDPTFARTRIQYQLANAKAGLVNGFAIELNGIRADQVAAITTPKGWVAELWYRERELGFDRLPPEIEQDAEARTFAGVLWRCREGGIQRRGRLAGFAVEFDIAQPSSDIALPQYEIDELGHGIVLEEDRGTTTAWHVNAVTLVKKKLRFRNPLEG